MRQYDKHRKRKVCNCCAGTHKTVVKKSRRAAARQESKKEIKRELEENTKNLSDFQRAREKYGYEIIQGYNEILLRAFMWTLRTIAPELGWADSDDHWYDMEPRGLSALPSVFKHWTPQTDEEYSTLLEKIIRGNSNG